jgi:uncharacterized protein (DUF1697 family)
MPALRELFEEAGFEDVRTYLQSGNVVLSSEEPPDRLAQHARELIAAQFGLEIDVIVRTREELAEVVKRNPLRKVATDPKRYQVVFLAREPDRSKLDKIAAVATDSEQMVARGRELYAWHPDGVGRSKLALALAGPKLGVAATARNWRTVTALLEL